jgi:hypothetical protein
VGKENPENVFKPSSIKEVNVVLDQLTAIVERQAKNLVVAGQAFDERLDGIEAQLEAIVNLQPQSTVVPPQKKEPPKRKWDTPEYRASKEYR